MEIIGKEKLIFLEQIITFQNSNLSEKMGCAACTEICGDVKNNIKANSDFLQIAKNKVMFLKKSFEKDEDKKLLYEFFTEEELNIILHLMNIEDELQPESILLPEAGEKFYLSQTRKTLWKLYSLDLLAYEYAKNPVIHQWTEDFSKVKISDKIQQRFYEIGLDINRTYPLVKTLNKDQLTLVLKNLTIFFEGVGYTQGMNFVVGFLLLCGFEPKEAYWMFIHLSFNRNFLFIRNFSEGFKNPMFIIKVFEQFMDNNKNIRELKQKLQLMGLNGSIYSFSWFICYFLYSLNPKCCVLVWDFLLTYNPSKPNINKKQQPLNETKKVISEKSQFQIEEQKKQKTNPEYFLNILNQRGSITSLIHLACEIMEFLQETITQCQLPEEIMKTFRNESLIQKITPQIIIGMIKRIKKKNSPVFGTFSQSWISFVQKMKTQDQQLYEIYAHQVGHRKFMQECLGLRRSYNQQMEPIKIKIVTKEKS